MNDLEKELLIDKKASRHKSNHTFDIIALVLCLIVAFFIWLFVVNNNRTVIEKTIIVTVDAKTQIEEATGLSIINGNDMTDFSQFKVTLKVSGTQSELDRYNDEDYIVRIQTEPIKEGGSGKYTVRFTDPILPGEGITLNSMEPAYFDAFIDELTEKEVAVEASVGEGGLSDGTLESIVPFDSNTDKIIDKVTIEGPKSTIDAVDKVTVKVNIANYSKSTVVKSQTFEFTDASGVPYKNDNNYITVKPSEVDVKLVITYTDKAVPISVKYTTTDSDIYKYDVKISFSDSTDAAIHLSGDSAAFPEKLEYDLKDITDLTGISFSVAQLIENGIIPEGLTVNNDDKSKTLTVTITKEKIVPDETTTGVAEGTNSPSDAQPNGSPSGTPDA